VTDTEANTIVRPLYLFITIVIIKEGRTKKTRLNLRMPDFGLLLSISLSSFAFRFQDDESSVVTHTYHE
jgi:hypothetical protein